MFQVITGMLGLIAIIFVILTLGFPGGLAGKELACNAGDPGLIPGLGRSPGEGNATHSSILAWKIPWTEEPGRLQSMGSQKSRTWLSDWHFRLALTLVFHSFSVALIEHFIHISSFYLLFSSFITFWQKPIQLPRPMPKPHTRKASLLLTLSFLCILFYYSHASGPTEF